MLYTYTWSDLGPLSRDWDLRLRKIHDDYLMIWRWTEIPDKIELGLAMAQWQNIIYIMLYTCALHKNVEG